MTFVPLQEVGKRTGSSTDDPRAGIGIGEEGDPMFTLQRGAQHGVAVAAPLTRGSACGDGVNEPGRRQKDDVNLVAYSLRRDPGGTGQGHNTNYVAVHLTQDPISGATSPARSKGNRHGTSTIGVSDGASVRRLTPTECERLQGFPDGWTQLGDTPDSRRYAALGDAVTVTVAEWIGRRIVAHATDAHSHLTASRPAPTYVASVVGTAGGRGPRRG